jgi:hypothetical protein
VQRIAKVLTVAALVTTVLMITSTVALARPLRGGVLLQNEKVCDMLVENHPLAESDDPRFELRPGSLIGPCWHTSPGLDQASQVVPSSP